MSTKLKTFNAIKGRISYHQLLSLVISSGMPDRSSCFELIEFTVSYKAPPSWTNKIYSPNKVAVCMIIHAGFIVPQRNRVPAFTSNIAVKQNSPCSFAINSKGMRPHFRLCIFYGKIFKNNVVSLNVDNSRANRIFVGNPVCTKLAIPYNCIFATFAT